MYLIKKKRWKIVTGDPVEQPGKGAAAAAVTSYNRWSELDNEASAAIGLQIHEDQYCVWRGKTTSKECWQDSLGNKVSLMHRICGKKLNEGINVEYQVSLGIQRTISKSCGLRAKTCR